MLFEEYIPLAQRTNLDLGSEVLNSVHMSIGMSSESYELLEAFQNKDTVNVGEELADKLWYLAGYIVVNRLDVKLEFDTIKRPVIVNGVSTDEGAAFFLFESELLDYDKKWLAYGKEKDIIKVKLTVKNLFICYNNLIIENGLSASTIMTNNIAKLKVRFPDKFDADKAINRDLESERVELEK